MDLNEIYTDTIAEHCTSTKNRREIENPDVYIEGTNASCGDEIRIGVKLLDGKIKDTAYTGVGCAISQASASIMSELVVGKTIDEALNLVNIFTNMIDKNITDKRQLELLYEGKNLEMISNMPARKKCATLAWNTFEQAVNIANAHNK